MCGTTSRKRREDKEKKLRKDHLKFFFPPGVSQTGHNIAANHHKCFLAQWQIGEFYISKHTLRKSGYPGSLFMGAAVDKWEYWTNEHVGLSACLSVCLSLSCSFIFIYFVYGQHSPSYTPSDFHMPVNHFSLLRVNRKSDPILAQHAYK